MGFGGHSFSMTSFYLIRHTKLDFWELEDMCDGLDWCFCSSCFGAKSSAIHILKNLNECVENECQLNSGSLKSGCAKYAIK